VLAWFIALTAAVIVGFLMLAQYSRKETAIGYLTPTMGTAKIFAPQAGTIKQVFVEEGEPVKEGQPLLALETNQIAAAQSPLLRRSPICGSDFGTQTPGNTGSFPHTAKVSGR